MDTFKQTLCRDLNPFQGAHGGKKGSQCNCCRRYPSRKQENRRARRYLKQQLRDLADIEAYEHDLLKEALELYGEVVTEVVWIPDVPLVWIQTKRLIHVSGLTYNIACSLQAHPTHEVRRGDGVTIRDWLGGLFIHPKTGGAPVPYDYTNGDVLPPTTLEILLGSYGVYPL